ncbi:hypothetical protein GCM10010954_01560 [Halobacillus andaensis]|uniref:Stage II sporulation protein B n=1 Tax=Halobacillus andaensis TaxID=1176239 RepID=A0A917AXD1_HALAA|nr:hypothetical protein [Halobacillus andaensis]MBP2002945.1 stage II sporulation protein B [Halobacillus andaensis]GGF06794.1 hypothetical protein GCM10010954_01560 [Halobacillus andaensis]
MAEKNNKIIISYNKDKETQQEIVQAKKEQAAADVKELQQSDELGSYSKVYKIPSFRKRLSPYSLKHVSLSVMTAIIVSFALGFILLKLFVSVTDETSPPVESVSGGQVQSTSAETVQVDLPSLKSEVVQSGVFTNEETAEEWQGKLEEQSVPSMIWKKDEQYFLLSGSEDAETNIAQVADELAELDIPTYLKSWEVAGGQLEIPESLLSTIENLLSHIQNHTLHTVPIEEREQLLSAWEDSGAGNEQFEKALQAWVSETDNGVSWLNIAQSLESLKN